jgi:hypothetical protein
LNSFLAASERLIRPSESVAATGAAVLLVGADGVWCDGLELEEDKLVLEEDGLERESEEPPSAKSAEPKQIKQIAGSAYRPMYRESGWSMAIRRYRQRTKGPI